MRNAVVYYSLTGNTEQVANEIAARIGADLIMLRPKTSYPDKGFIKIFKGGKSAMMHETPELEPYVFDAYDYDRVIIGMPIWAGNVTPPIRSFIAENSASLKGIDTAVFACCKGGVKGAKKAIDKLMKLMPESKLVSSVILIDPAASPTEENKRRINEFISTLV